MHGQKEPDAPIKVNDTTFNQLIQQHHLMLIDCWAPWCGPCQIIGPLIDEISKDYAGKVVFGKLNVDENPQTSERFGIFSIPTLLVMKNGSEVDRIVGAVPRQLIEAKLKKYI